MKEKYSPEMARKKFHLMGQILPIASSWLVVEKNLMGTTKIRQKAPRVYWGELW